MTDRVFITECRVECLKRKRTTAPIIRKVTTTDLQGSTEGTEDPENRIEKRKQWDRVGRVEYERMSNVGRHEEPSNAVLLSWWCFCIPGGH